MIHEFIDYKKKTKNSGTSNGKTLRNSIETCSAEQSGSEWPSTTFIPPWLNNLGLKLKNNQNLDWSACLPNFTALVYGALDQRTEKLRPDVKNQNQDEQNEGEERKSTVEEDQSKKSFYCESSQKECEEERLIQISESYRKLHSAEKQNREASNTNSQIPVFWQVRSKVGDADSSSSESILSPLLQKKKNFKMTETEVSGKTLANVGQVKNEQEKKKLPKKLHRIKYRTTSRHGSLSKEIDVDSLLEEKAKKILENHPKKKIQSAASDIKRFEAKLLLLHTKICLGKLTPEDMRFLHEIKARTGSKENFDKLMRHVREVNLKEIFETESSILKSVRAKKDVENTKIQYGKEEKTLMSTDDENDIKRFSDKLKKNLNKEEKRKCLEEVRNYFEKKRRTRLTKCWMLNANSKESDIEEEENHKNDKTNMKNVFPDRTAADWKAKFKINDAEVVGKAVDETLQKFVELYHFHVPPSLMSSMKKNVLKGIKSKTFEGDQALTWHLDVPSNVEGDKLSTKLKKNIIRKDYPEKESLSKDLKTKNLNDRTLSGPQLIRKNVVESEEIKRLKSELEYYFNNANEDVTRLKVHSIILEEEKQDPSGKNMEFIYSFAKKSLEQKNSESMAGVMTELPLKDMEIQADKIPSAANAKTQTRNLVTAYERHIQTEKNPQKSVDVQTEGTYAIELKKLKESDVSPGLYRMVRSKQAGRFYLYPENEEHLVSPPKVTTEGNKNNTFEERKFTEKKLNRTSEESEPNKKKREAKVSDALTVDGMKSENEADLASVPENKWECIWLWDGKKINSGTDLKAHVESLLKEKLKEMSYGSEESGKDKFNLLTRNFAKAGGTGSQDNLEFAILHSGLSLENEHVGLRLENKIQNCGEGSAGTQSLGEPQPTSEEKLVKDASTQNSEQAVLSLNVKTWKSSVKSQTSSKTYLRKKRKMKVKRDRRYRQSISDLKKAMQLMSECLSNKRMKFEVDSSPKESICDSGTTLESNTSSCSKDTSDDHLTLIFGLKDSPGFKNKIYKRKMNEQVQTHIGKNSGIKNLADNQKMENHMHWALIERVLHRVNCKKRKSLWNDVRKIIKSKIGKDIDNEDAKEVCIQIEQDMRGVLGEKANNSVLAKGYYARNEGDVEIEIDLTLKDLERIIRRRERNRRRRNLYYKRNSRSLRSSSPGQSRSNFASIQEFRNVLRSVSRSRPSPLPGDISIFQVCLELNNMMKNTEGGSLPDDNLQDQALPLPIQIFLWRQISPFIRPKLGKLHEASCMFCQQAPGHHSFEKVLVQNIQYGLSPCLTTAVASVPRWRLIQAAFPYVMHCTATLLHNRKDTSIQTLGATETKMLYTLHWILLVAAEECADADHENGVFQTSPFYYLFSIPAITLFIYLFAPIYHHLKESDFETYRLENGLKMWQALWDYRHPDTPCFTAHVKPKPKMLWNRFIKGSHLQFGDVFMGRQQSSDEGLVNVESPQSQSASASYCSEQYSGVPAQINVRVEPAKPSDEEGNWVSSPKDTVFPETIPEESSSTEEEHVVIFRLPSLTESDGVEKPGSLYTADPSIFHLSMNKNLSSRPTLTIEQVTALSVSDVRQGKIKPPPIQKMESSTDKESVSSKGQMDSGHKLHNVSMHSSDVCAATFLDVAVLRCLFMSQWPEEGVYWALQFFYHRLREISEETNTQQQPRRRSNSLPIPKIEVSLYQSPEMKKKDTNKDFIEVPEVKDVARVTESPYFSWKQNEESVSHARRASEKVTKKKMKMADLRAFVETKLLSKSERTLEKIGTEEQKPFFMQQEYHHSLDTGEDHFSRPSSALGKIFEHRGDFKPLGWGNLVKGKSMPSLRYIGDQDKHMKSGRMLGAHSHTITNPIITVTEHTPAPSPDFLKRQVSIESQLDDSSLQSKQQFFTQERKLSLTRSQTDSNITYACDELPEAPGASHYITKDGDIDIQVVLKAVHSAALRDNICCTLRVCEVILNLLELLIDMGVLKHSSSRSGSDNSGNKQSGKEDKESNHSSEHEDIKEEYSTAKSLHEKHYTAHDLVLNSVLRVYKHLGCPHGCGEGQRGPPADFLRSQGQTILSKLQRSNPKRFSKFLRSFVRNQSLTDILEFFHAYIGFCVDPTSLLSPLNQKRSFSKSPEMMSQGAYSMNFGAGLKGGGSRGVESQIMASIFKTLVTRLIKLLKELKIHENMVLYCEIRQLMIYIKEAHGGVFRRVALSGLIDSVSRPNKKQDVQTTRVVRHVSHSETEDQTDMPGSSYYLDEKGQKKLLFKKRSTSSACAATLEMDGTEEGGKSQSPLGNVKKKHQPVLTPRQSEKNLGMSELAKGIKGDKGSKFIPKIGSLVNWFKKEYGRSDSTDSHDDNDAGTECGGTLTRQQSMHPHALGKSASKGSSGDLKQALQKTRKKVEDQIKKNFGFRKGKRKDGSLEETSGNYMSRKSSVDYGDSSREADYVIFRERKLVPLLPVLKGMMRFSFLLETCHPGSVPDHHLLAAILDLPHAPVVSRASLLLECAYFVHNCNKGQWPTWMKLNFPVVRPSMPNQSRNNNNNSSSNMRRIHILQRASGKLFYQWAEAISNRLEEMLHKDRLHIPEVVSMVTEESRQKELLIEDEEEDFLDEASVNFCGNECPIALRMIACVLLLEITAFLRETYQALPKSSRASNRDRLIPWERTYSKEANRRWSMALSSMGHSQASAQSLQSITADKDSGVQNERKISFVLHEPDNESEGSSNTTVTMQGEEAEEKDKKKTNRTPSTSTQQSQGRPFLLRRGTATNTTGSFKRRSLKLRRGTKEGIKESDCDFKRTDSIQSKRKVSSLSDRSDTSEPGVGGEVSGEESPGVLSDDQPLESPSDSNETDDTSKNMPWMKVVVQFAHSFNFYCSHQSFCHPFCYRRHMRACERLMKAVRKVYGEESNLLKTMEEEVSEKHHEIKKEKMSRGRKVSDQTSIQTSPVRRKDSFGRKDKIDGRQKDEDVEKSKIGGCGSKKWTKPERPKETLPIMKYLKTQVKNVFHVPLSILVKGAVVLSEDLFIDIIPVAWELLLESDQEVAATAASLFILCSVRAPNHASDLIHHALSNQETSVRINAILRFQVLWKLRYQVWPRMEEGAHVTFKVPPPGIEFTLPSPKIGIESLPVVDPPWVPQVQTKVEEVTISQESHRALVTATKTRKKQQTELITMALQAQEDKKRVERENFLITTIPVTVQAAYQPSLYHAGPDDQAENDEDQCDIGGQGRNTVHHTNAVHSLFPSCLCSAVIQIINLLDDAAVSSDGNAVYEVAYSVMWNCLVEDSALFLRYILERITREKQEQMFKILRHLIRFVPKLPQQAAFALYNYIIGYVMFYVRSSHEEGQQHIGTALSILWMVVHSVHGIMFKDLKQILRKEQCDASILLTANVPSAKKIIVHGPQEQDAAGIPSQFPVGEDTQFCQILRESLDFFGVDESKHKEYFLVDHKTRQIHNPSSYVRDFYFFKRSQYPQLELVWMKPEDAFNGLQRQELIHKFVEIGKVLLTWAILKNVDMVVQRVVFLHEELMKLPSFPRKALEADLDLYKKGELGKELLGLDVLHKFMWVRLISRMFEAMAGNFAYSGDIHLLLNVLNGALILHSEDSCILRYVMATYINAAHNFKNIFSTNGYLLIMPTLLQIYSNHQTNKLVTRTVEYCVKQFYLMNRKPFILQMFGSLSAILDTEEEGQYGDAHKVQAKCLFQLLLSLETPSPDPLNIGELVKEEKPLKAIDFCYHDESEMVTVLDCISLCIMVIAYASDSVRGHQMLIILEAILPYYLQQIQKPSYEKDGKTEKEIIQQLAVAIRTLVHNCEALAKNYNGPQRSSPEHKGSSQRNYSRGAYSPGFDFEDDSHSRFLSDHSRSKMHYERGDMEDSEVLRNEFRRPRDILLSLVADFHSKCTVRLAEIHKKTGYDGKTVEILDVKSHLRLVDIAHSLLKVAPYDPDTMGCRGLQRYINDILPSTEWSNDAMRPALITILRRLDKTFNKIYKKASIRRHTDWDAAAGLLKGIYETLARCPYIVHMQHLKTLINTCQSLILGDASNFDISANEPLVVRILMTMIPPPHFCSTVVRLIVMQILLMGESYSLEQVCGSSVFPNKKKTESMLMNLIIPLCMRVGSGRKDVPRMRQQDISFALTVVLHAMCPPATLTAQNIKSLSEMRSGSLAVGKETKKPIRLPQSTYQVSFLALKIIMVCFENELTNDWHRIAKTVKDVGRILDLGTTFWDFLDFVASQRTPLFVLLLPFIHQKVNSPPLNDQQRHMQFIIREKLKGYSLPVTKCRSALLIDLAHEIKELKEELENGKIDDAKGGDQLNRSNSQSGDITGVSHVRHHRPSLIGIFTGDLTSKTNQLASDIQMKLARSQRNSISSGGEKKIEEATATADESSSTTVKGSSWKVSDTSDPQRKPSVKLRFTSNVEMKDDSGETSITPLSPASPNEDSSGETAKYNKPRLQRSKAQSRKTFRLRKSRKSRMGPNDSSEGKQEKQSYSTPATPTQITPQATKLLLEQLKEAKLKEMLTKDEVGKQEEKDTKGEGKRRGSASSDKVIQSSSSSGSKRPEEGTTQPPATGLLPYQGPLNFRNNLLKAELSVDDDTSAVSQTSSTSGYRESCSFITMTMESPTPQRPSSIPATTSPESSLTSIDGDETAVLARSSSSQHSLMMLFETQDEDTLI